MKIDQENHCLIFSNGKTVPCYAGVVGINPELSVREGYDGYLDDENAPCCFTPADRLELAEEMIKLWQAYGEKAAQDIGP